MNNKGVFLSLILIIASLSMILYIFHSPEDDHYEDSNDGPPRFDIWMEYDETLYQYTVRIGGHIGYDISLSDVLLNVVIGFETPFGTPYHFLGNITHTLEDYLDGINIVIPDVEDNNSSNTQHLIVRDYILNIKVFDEDQNGLLTVGDFITIKIYSEDPFLAGTQAGFGVSVHNMLENNEWMGSCRCVGLLDMQPVNGEGSKPAEDREDE